MARALSDILSELDNVYNPQRQVYNQQITTLPDQQLAEEKGLQSAKQDAFQQITDQANRRGLFYSGIPVAEEQKYTGSTFLPAVANVRNNYATRKFNLQDALSKITQDQYLHGQDIHQKELDREQAAALARAGSAGAASPSFGFGGSSAGVLGASASATASQRSGGGYNFTDAYGNSISAASYAAQKGIPFRTLLEQMASAGDTGARAALGFVGNDYGYDPTKVTDQNSANLYNSLIWGTGLNQAGIYSPSSPAPASSNNPLRTKPLTGNSIMRAFAH